MFYAVCFVSKDGIHIGQIQPAVCHGDGHMGKVFANAFFHALSPKHGTHEDCAFCPTLLQNTDAFGFSFGIRSCT